MGARDRELLRRFAVAVGIDEVGRGALAGPVVVAAVAFERIPDQPTVKDSKALTARQREAAAVWIRRHCAAWLVVEVWVELIDRINILEATRLAMRSAARSMVDLPAMTPRDPGRRGGRRLRDPGRGGVVVIVDNLELGEVGCAVVSEASADANFFSVAAASIVAKVHRDRVMAELSGSWPQWQWERNRGYGTTAHRRALDSLGRSTLHRTSFGWSPVLP